MKRMAVALLALALFAAPLAAEAQPPRRIPRIGWLSPGSAQSPPHPTLEGFRQGLRELGYVEGQAVAIEYRYAEGKFERFPDLAAGLVGLGVDVIVTGGGPASLAAAKNATSAIPIVMAAASSDPVGQGLIASLARPGGNITGLATAPQEPWSKRFELLKEAVPGLSRVPSVSDANIGPYRLPKEAEEAARLLRLQLLPFEVRTPDDFQGAVEAAVKEKAEALHVTPTPLFSGTRRARLIELVTKHRLPTISMWRDFAEAGGPNDLWTDRSS